MDVYNPAPSMMGMEMKWASFFHAKTEVAHMITASITIFFILCPFLAVACSPRYDLSL